jgi:glyoxylase-like metal-dependent hydrolase (beta-lactamase superfamily II)
MTVSKLHVLNAADWAIDNSITVQLQDMGETYTMPCPVYLIEHPEGTVLVDTGVSYDMKQNPEEYGPHGAPHMSAFVDALEMDEDQEPVYQLEDRGVSASEVDYVVMTHLHNDHAGTMSDFPDAEFVVQEEELRYAFWPEPSQQIFYLQGDFGMLRSSDVSVTATRGAYDVFGDDSVVTIPTPGHTKGHQSVRVELDGQTVVLSADVALQQSGYEMERPVSFNWSLSDSIESIRTIREEVRRRDAELVLHHEREHIDPLLGEDAAFS